MHPLITNPVFPPSGQSRHDGDEREAKARRRDTRSQQFDVIGGSVVAIAATPQGSRALTTPRDALYFRLQTETLPGPGSTAPYLAQHIGQLWIAPDARIGYGYAATAYQRADQAGVRMAAGGTGRSIIV